MHTPTAPDPTTTIRLPNSAVPFRACNEILRGCEKPAVPWFLFGSATAAYWDFALVKLTNLAFSTISRRIKAPNCSGVVVCGSTPPFLNKSLISEVFATLAITALSCAMMFFGTPAGASKPCQLERSYPANPDSSRVGISGIKVARFAVVTASGLSLPEDRNGSAEGMVR